MAKPQMGLLVLEGDYGPKMLTLPRDEWREFVRLYCAQGQRDATRAYMLAYHFPDEGTNKHNCQGSASRLLRDNRIQEAILECCQKQLRALAPLAVEVFEEVASNKAVAPSDRLKAATAIADRTGLHALTEHKTTVQHIGQDPDQLKRIAALAALLNVDARVLLGNRIEAPTIDVTPKPEDFADEEY